MPKSILVINDIPGAGKVASNINLPILSAALFEVSILPTLILSKNTDYDQGEVVRYSMGQGFQEMMDHWIQAQLEFDLYTTGFFTSTDQIKQFHSFYKKQTGDHGPSRLYVDPIMGDHGQLYPGFNEDIPSVIGDLCQDAYLVVPNVTEACLMTGYPYTESMSENQLAELAQGLINRGAENVVLSGIEDVERYGKDQIGFFLYQSDQSYKTIMHKKFHVPFFGTGDMAMSLIIALHENGLSLSQTLKETGSYIEKALQLTMDLDRGYQAGVYFEPILLDLGTRIHDLQVNAGGDSHD